MVVVYTGFRENSTNILEKVKPSGIYKNMKGVTVELYLEQLGK